MGLLVLRVLWVVVMGLSVGGTVMMVGWLLVAMLKAVAMRSE